MEIILSGKHIDLSDRFKELANKKLERLNKLAAKAKTVEVTVSKKHNPVQNDASEKVEILVTGLGKELHSEAKAQDQYSAFDAAFDKIESQLRKAHDIATTIDRTKLTI
jgi:ribosomal subunit interface protein